MNPLEISSFLLGGIPHSSNACCRILFLILSILALGGGGILCGFALQYQVKLIFPGREQRGDLINQSGDIRRVNQRRVFAFNLCEPPIARKAGQTSWSEMPIVLTRTPGVPTVS